MLENPAAQSFSLPEGALIRKSILNIENKSGIRAMKKAGKELVERGIAKKTDGSLSVRLEHGFCITTIQADLAQLSDEDFSVVESFNADANRLEKAMGQNAPASEMPIHFMIYKMRHNIRAAMVFRDPAVSRPGVAEKLKLPSAPSAVAAVELLANNDMAIISGYGAIVTGSSVEECSERANILHRRGMSVKI